MSTFLTEPTWDQYLVIGIIIMFFVIFSGVALTKAGRSPLWTLLLLFPVCQVIALWVFAFSTWKENKPTQS